MTITEQGAEGDAVNRAAELSRQAVSRKHENLMLTRQEPTLPFVVRVYAWLAVLFNAWNSLCSAVLILVFLLLVGSSWIKNGINYDHGWNWFLVLSVFSAVFGCYSVIFLRASLGIIRGQMRFSRPFRICALIFNWYCAVCLVGQTALIIFTPDESDGLRYAVISFMVAVTAIVTFLTRRVLSNLSDLQIEDSKSLNA